MRRLDVDRSKLSPMMIQYMNIKDMYSDTILFCRIGDFYEMFFEDAITASHELEIALTGKQCGLEERVPMCGIPFHSYLPYMEKLVDKGYKVAICEQLTLPDNKGVVERGVVEVVTKGTLIGLNSLDEKSNNYIGAIYDFTHCYVLTYADISTGCIYSLLVEHDTEKLINEVIKLNIMEVVVNNDIDSLIISILSSTYNISISISSELCSDSFYDYVYSDIDDLRISTSVRVLLGYLVNTKKSTLSHLQKVSIINKKEYLELDLYSKRNLELTQTLRQKDRVYSLLWLLDKTKTAMGARLLKSYIEYPLVNKKFIERRYCIISKFLTEFILKEELRTSLGNIYDLERLCGRISYGNLSPRDLLWLRNSLRELPNIKRLLKDLEYDKTIDILDDLCDLLDNSINENVTMNAKDGNIIKSGYNKTLDELRCINSSSKDFLLDLEMKEKERTGIKLLKLGFNKVFGYYIEIPKGNIKDVKDDFGYTRKQTLANAERYITNELKEKEELILSAEEKIISLDYNLFIEIRNITRGYISRLQEVSKVLSEVDVMLSLAVVAEENGYIKPTIVDDRCVYIKDGKHPVVEKVSKNTYVPNDIIMDEKTNILLITGPNMSGKSTYMRMMALIVIMAQMGSYVPCKEAKLPIFDKIFTRIGASDDLVSGESTFMVEMKEANNAVSNATINSLILFDELGRGTATYDGMSLASAILEYIHNNIKAKTLFSTHYHELTTLDKRLKNLKNVHVSAVEEKGNITFLHKVKNGAVDKSYGIHVASLVNLPSEIIKRATEILEVYENQKPKKERYTQMGMSFDFEDNKENEVLKKLKEIDPLEITPIDAINLIYKLKKEMEYDKFENK